MDEGLSAALLVRVALGVVHGLAEEPERSAWTRLGDLVARTEPAHGQLIPIAQRELLEFEASPVDPARAEALLHALDQRAQRDPRFSRELAGWAQDARQRSFTHDHGPDFRSASLHGSVVQSGPDSLVTFVTYGPPAPSRHP
ncbi:hypothetical protein [Streptomyces sp. NPDC013457]|uniref:hypothetical protein n=1 Tax=Streptomyces sp. NPDC013457 TaxID=3364866 RepID=UPI0036FE1EB2